MADDTIWKVLLIGGSSGVGKTIVAQEIAFQQKCSVLSTDDLRMAMLKITTPETHPTLHFLENADIETISSDVALQGLIDVATIVSSGLSAIISHHCHLSETGRIVIEGDAILPAIISPSPDVRGVIIKEKSLNTLHKNMIKRGRGPFTPKSIWWNDSRQQILASISWQFSEWLSAQAKLYDVPIIMTRPWTNLHARIEHIINA